MFMDSYLICHEFFNASSYTVKPIDGINIWNLVGNILMGVIITFGIITTNILFHQDFGTDN